MHACNKGNTWKFAIAEHQWHQQHQMDWDVTRIQDRARPPIVQLKVKEALHIERTLVNKRLNWDGGYKLPGCCIATMKKLGVGATALALTNRASGSPSAPNCMHGCVSAVATPIWAPAFHFTFALRMTRASSRKSASFAEQLSCPQRIFVVYSCRFQLRTMSLQYYIHCSTYS